MPGDNLRPVKLPFLPAPMREARRAWLAIPVAWLTALGGSLALAFVVDRLMPGAQQPDFGTNLKLAAFLIVVFAPVVETLIMAGAITVFLRFLGPTGAVLASAAGWGIAHTFGAPAWGLVIWWPFLVFSTVYVTWRERSLGAALAVTMLVHAMQNAVPAAFMLAGKT